MVYRKPYAFLAKHFKLIHGVLAVLLLYLLYRTNNLMTFYNTHAKVQQELVSTVVVNELFNKIMFFIPFLWIFISAVILALMINKKKPITFYIVNIVMASIILTLYTFASNITTQLTTQLVDIRLLRGLRDIIFFVMIGQTIVTLMVLVRATGFDIKKFDFVKDLQSIEVSEKDREEVEVSLEVDTDSTRRSIRRNIRNAKYVYLENKFAFNIAGGLALIILMFYVFMNLNIYHKTYKMGQHFVIENIEMSIENAYVTTKDYKGNRITKDGKSLVVLDISTKRKIRTNKVLELASATLIVNNNVYYPIDNYKDKTIDLGKTYRSEVLTDDFTRYIITYEVPTNVIGKKMKFEYYDKRTVGNDTDLQRATVAIRYQNLDGNEKDISAKLGEELRLEGSVLGDTVLKIDNLEIASSFVHTYRFCPKKGECYDSIEYIKPALNNNYDKTVLKVNGNVTIGENSNIQGISNLYNLISTIGRMEYTLNGVSKTQTLAFKEINVKHSKNQDENFIEIQKEIENAEKVELVLKIRNRNYRYTIK